MGSGVYHRIAIVVVREIRIIGLAVESKLEDTHPRQLKLIAKSIHIRCDQPQILSDEWQRAQFSLYCLKEIGARTRDPLARLCRQCSYWYVPRRREPADPV